MRLSSAVRSRVLASTVASASCLALVVGLAPAAQGRAPRTPAKATHVKIAAATSSSITVTTARAAYAKKYKLFVSTSRADVYVDNMKRNKHSKALHTATASGPRMTVRGLRYTTNPYWYRVQTINGTKSSFSADILGGGVRPSTPSKLTVSGANGLSLTWSAGATTGFRIRQATNSKMTTGVRDWTVAGNTHQFTPYGIKPGVPYWFAVRSRNNGTASGWSNHASGTTSAREQNLRFMTYNVLLKRVDGTTISGHKVSPWSSRGPAAAAVITSASPDVVAVQEAGDWIRENSTRQIDSLLAYLGGKSKGWALATTEYPFHRSGETYCGRTTWYCRAHSYILYRTSSVRPLGDGGHFEISPAGKADKKFAAWQRFESVQTGAKFVMVSTHTIAGRGKALGERRRAETTSLLTRTRQIADGLPVIYGGDFNSNTNAALYSPDGPGAVMRGAGAPDAREVAQKHYNDYSSVNYQYSRTPLRHPENSIDHLYASAGVSPYSWGVAIRTKRGKVYGTVPSDHHAVYSTMVVRY